jgi:ceramide glucosyltransferase
MDLSATLALAGAAWWALTCAVRIGSYAAAFIEPRRRERQATRRDQPPVSIIIPVRRLEADAAAAFTSAYTQAYPRIEVITAAEETSSPALDLAREVAQRFPQVESRVLGGNPRFTPNPKVSNLAPAIAAARHDLVLVKDANIRLDDAQLAELVRNLTDGVGLVCAVPIVSKPVGFAADIEAAFLNGHQAPLMYAASMLATNICIGKVMLFDRRDFHRAGGIEVIARSFGDDHELAKALARIGLRTVYGADVVRQPLGRRSLRDVADRQERWMVIRRTEEPFAFAAEPFTSCLFGALAGAAGAGLLALPSWLVFAATVAGWLLLESLAVAAKGWGWSWRFPLAGLCRELMIPVLWVRAMFARRVRWAGLPFDVPRDRARRKAS